MKIMTCNQLGGACSKQFSANTFDEMARLAQEHGKEMAKVNDPEHLKAMKKMVELMNNPKDMKDWMDKKRQEFDSLPDVS